MAISNISKGVYIVSPEKVKRWQDTAAGKYTSVFTKGRADQWELALAQAQKDAGIKELEYKAAVELYQDRLRQQERELADIEKLRIQVLNGQVRAEDAATALGMRLGQQQAAADARREEAVAKTRSVTTGTTVRETGTPGAAPRAAAGGGAATGALTKIDKKAQDEIGLAKAKAPATNPVALATEMDTRINAGRVGAGTGPEADAARYRTVNESVEARAAQLQAADSTMTAADAKDAATITVLQELRQGGRAAFADSYESFGAQLDTETGGGGAVTPGVRRDITRTTTTGRRTELVSPGLAPEAPTPEAVEVPVASREDVLAALTAREAAVRGRQFQMPVAPSTDLITRAREVAAARFGPRVETPAFEMRNALDRFYLLPEDQRQKALEAYRASVEARSMVEPSAAAPSLPGAPGAPSAAPAAGAPEPGAARVRPPPREPAPQYDFTDRTEFRMEPGQGVAGLINEAVDLAATPREGFLTEEDYQAGQAMAERKFQQAKALAAEQASIEAETAAAERPFQVPFEQRGGETVPFYRRPGGPADVRSMEMAALGMSARPPREPAQQFFEPERPPRFDTPALRAARETSFAPPPRETRTLPFGMVAPTVEVAPVDVQFPRRPVVPPPELGVKEEGALMSAAPAEPSTAMAAPRQAARLDTVGPVTGAAERARGTIKAEETAQVAGMLGDKQLGVTGKREPSAMTYLANRWTAAGELVAQPAKLARLRASGPGKAAADMYFADKSSGVGFNQSWEKMSALYTGDDRIKAHEVLLAIYLSEQKKAPQE